MFIKKHNRFCATVDEPTFCLAPKKMFRWCYMTFRLIREEYSQKMNPQSVQNWQLVLNISSRLC